MLLVIGPTCAGKSTYIETLRKDAAADGRELEVHFGFEVRRGKDVPTGPDDVVHANLLKGGAPNSRADEDVVQIAPGQRQDLAVGSDGHGCHPLPSPSSQLFFIYSIT